MEEFDTDPELLWPLLLAQIVYDQASSPDFNFQSVSNVYKDHPLLPHSAPALDTSEDAQKVYEDLIQENAISETDRKIEAQKLAEIYYFRFRENLASKLAEDSRNFEQLYRMYENAAGVPNEERLNE